MARAQNENIRLYPMLFKPVYKDIIWGGSRLRDCLGRADAPERCAESWEIADRPDGMSVVANGPLSGQTLGALAAARGADLLGIGAEAGPFPLLCKIIDARERLSLQVHPKPRPGALAVSRRPRCGSCWMRRPARALLPGSSRA